MTQSGEFMKDIAQKIYTLLKMELRAQEVLVIDESHRHAGHAQALRSGKGHYIVTVVSDLFKGVKSVDRHRMIHKVLEKEFATDIHALAIKAYSIDEYQFKDQNL